MFKKVKKILGIEGVKMELNLPEQVKLSERLILGKLKFTSITDQLVKSVNVELIEKYSRGRKTSKLVDEYKLGAIQLSEPIEVKAHSIVEVEFELPFVIAKSEMDMIEESNFLFRGNGKSSKVFQESQIRIPCRGRGQGERNEIESSLEL